MMFNKTWRRVFATALLALICTMRVLEAQTPVDTRLDSLVAVAQANSPRLTLAVQRAAAARARVKPAGTAPDPMMGVGIMNKPVAQSRYDDMTMHVAELRQSVPYPGKLALRRHAAELDAEASDLMVDVVKREIARDVKSACYNLAYLDTALAITRKRQLLTSSIVEAAKARYVSTNADQATVVKAQLEASGVARTLAALTAERASALMELNALLRRPLDATLVTAPAPTVVELPPLQDVLDATMHRNAEIIAHEPMIAAQSARVDAARVATHPDFDITFQYGNRPARPDMLSLMVGVLLPIHRRNMQDQQAAEAMGRLHELHAEHDSLTLMLQTAVARLYTEINGLSAQLAVLTRASLPDARTIMSSTLAGYVAGRIDLATALGTQSAVFDHEISEQDLLARRAAKIAQLETLSGLEIVR